MMQCPPGTILYLTKISDGVLEVLCSAAQSMQFPLSQQMYRIHRMESWQILPVVEIIIIIVRGALVYSELTAVVLLVFCLL